MSKVDKYFLNHPRSVGETYMEHQGFAVAVSLKLFIAATACLIHALVPALFERTASRIVRDVYFVTQKRRVP